MVAAVSISGSTHRVEPGQAVVVSGVVTSEEGSPLRRKRVTLQARAGGRWFRVGSGRTDASGQVSLVLPPVTASTAVRLRSNGVHSARWRITMHPQVSLSSTPGPDDGTVVITATTAGAQPGDRVLLVTKAGQVASATLGEGGSASFTVTPAVRRTRYVVLLPATEAHGPDRASIAVIVRKPGGQPGASDGG